MLRASDALFQDPPRSPRGRGAGLPTENRLNLRPDSKAPVAFEFFEYAIDSSTRPSKILQEGPIM